MSMPRLVVEVAFTGTADASGLLQLDDPTRGILNDGRLSGAGGDAPLWEDITPWVRSGTIRRGSSRVEGPIVQYDAGTCAVVLDNADRRFDPSHLGGPYVADGATLVTAMRAVRIRAVWAGQWYELFRGFADAWSVDWSGPAWSECTLTASDAFKILSAIDRVPVSLPVGAGEHTGARVHRILDSAGWPAQDRAIATGNSTMQGTTLEGSALAELQTAADSELGELYVEAGGRVVFRNRKAMLTDTRSNTPRAVFGDGGGAELPYQELEIATDDATFYTEVRVSRVDGAEQMVSDTGAQAVYYRRTFKAPTELMVQTDAETLSYAQWLLYVSTVPEVRFTALGINPRSDPDALFPHALGRSLGDRITVVRRPPGGGDPASRDCFIRGIEHEFSPAEWRTSWTLQSADKYGRFLTLNHGAHGSLNRNALAY